MEMEASKVLAGMNSSATIRSPGIAPGIARRRGESSSSSAYIRRSRLGWREKRTQVLEIGKREKLPRRGWLCTAMSEGDKGEYKLVVDDDADKRASVSYPEGAQLKSESVASHPALPVLCYCIASISMTVINKASSPRVPGPELSD